MKTHITFTVACSILLFASCKKDDSSNKSPNQPTQKMEIVFDGHTSVMQNAFLIEQSVINGGQVWEMFFLSDHSVIENNGKYTINGAGDAFSLWFRTPQGSSRPAAGTYPFTDSDSLIDIVFYSAFLKNLDIEPFEFDEGWSAVSGSIDVSWPSSTFIKITGTLEMEHQFGSFANKNLKIDILGKCIIPDPATWGNRVEPEHTNNILEIIPKLKAQ